jgi:hypothetical protein
MFNAQQRGLVTDEGSSSLVPMVIWLFNAYAGLSTAVAGFVLDNAVLVGVGLLLVVSGSALANLISKVMKRSQSGQRDFYERGERCALSHPSLRPSTPSVKNSVSRRGPLSIKTVLTLSPTRRATVSGYTSMSIEPEPKALTAQPLPTAS